MRPLTPQEKVVLTLLSDGSTSQKVADDLNLSKRTIDMYRAHIRIKFEAASIAECVEIAKATGIIQ